MANHKSALKRAKQSEIKRVRNKSIRTRINNIIKQLKLAVNENASEKVAKNFVLAQSVIDKASKKGVIHRKTAARKISRLTRLITANKV